MKTYAGLDLDVDLLATDFSDTRAVTDRRYELRRHLDQLKRGCECLTIEDREKLPWSAPLEEIPELATLSVVRSCTPWLHLEHCRVCGQYWFIAEDTVDDDIYFHRLSSEEARNIIERDQWPTTFDSKEAVWPDQGWLEAEKTGSRLNI
ncbi:MAG TPA: hypothetical protein VIU85_05420 [Chthoniobacterales bacterium]